MSIGTVNTIAKMLSVALGVCMFIWIGIGPAESQSFKASCSSGANCMGNPDEDIAACTGMQDEDDPSKCCSEEGGDHDNCIDCCAGLPAGSDVPLCESYCDTEWPDGASPPSYSLPVFNSPLSGGFHPK